MIQHDSEEIGSAVSKIWQKILKKLVESEVVLDVSEEEAQRGR